MTKMQACQICGTETQSTEAEAAAVMAEMEAQGLKAMAICGTCTTKMALAHEMSALFGLNFDAEQMAAIFRDMATSQAATGSPRQGLIRQLWAVVKRHGVDYTADPVAVEHDPFSDDKVVFERKTYAGRDVIECEGVIVERL
jgi:hypothetical protein